MTRARAIKVCLCPLLHLLPLSKSFPNSLYYNF
jgi:hypothetical protein